MLQLSKQQTNFFDPIWTSDGRAYGPERYKQIVSERYLISKHTNTSYQDTLKINPIERAYIIQFIARDLEKQRELIESKRK